ncbi:hypothetical protein [Bradyrhizobium sp. LB11.1]|uniref:hypothetical protein n=1 Tax=Bradyrhizobium sp. LB11.1 TaxID=3156326 RepID=UPI00339764EB
MAILLMFQGIFGSAVAVAAIADHSFAGPNALANALFETYVFLMTLGVCGTIVLAAGSSGNG